MHAIDEQLEVAARELHDVLDGVRLAPASTVARRHKRRRHTTAGAAAVIAVLGVIGLTIVATRDVDSNEPGSAIADPIAQRLLYPPGLADVDIQKIYLGPDLSTNAKGLVQSPDGTLFHISIGERGGWQMTPNVERRDINGHTFTVETINSELTYVALGDCAVVGMQQSGPDATAWDTDASALLAAMTINGLTAAVDLPPGWKSFGVGNGGHLIQLAFTSRVGGSAHAVVLMQAPDSAVASISRIALGDEPLTSTTFNNQQAWTVSSAANSTNSLIWQDGPNAVLLSGQATLDELKQIAGALEHNHADDWARLLPTAENLSGSVGTTPPDTSPDPTTTNANNCGTPRLIIQQTSATPNTNTDLPSP